MIQAVLGLFMALALPQALEVRDVSGSLVKPFRVEGKSLVLFFLSRECPISRFYAREIQAICSDKSRGAELEQKLDPGRFISIHRSTILNLDHLLELRAMFGGTMVARLRDSAKTELSVSRDRAAVLKRRLGL